MNAYTVLASKKYRDHAIEFRKTTDGGIYASVTKGDSFNLVHHLADCEWPSAVAEYVTREIENYCVMGMIP